MGVPFSSCIKNSYLFRIKKYSANKFVLFGFFCTFTSIKPKIMDKKESREAHKKAFLELLKRGEVLTQHKHGKIFKCARLAARIYDIKQAGHPIVTTMIYNEKT